MPSLGDAGIRSEELGPELPWRDKAWGCKGQRLGIQVSSRTPHLYLLPDHGPDPRFPLPASGFWGWHTEQPQLTKDSSPHTSDFHLLSFHKARC